MSQAKRARIFSLGIGFVNSVRGFLLVPNRRLVYYAALANRDRMLFVSVWVACYPEYFRKLFRQLTLVIKNEQISRFGSGHRCCCFGSLR